MNIVGAFVKWNRLQVSTTADVLQEEEDEYSPSVQHEFVTFDLDEPLPPPPPARAGEWTFDTLRKTTPVWYTVRYIPIYPLSTFSYRICQIIENLIVPYLSDYREFNCIVVSTFASIDRHRVRLSVKLENRVKRSIRNILYILWRVANTFATDSIDRFWLQSFHKVTLLENLFCDRVKNFQYFNSTWKKRKKLGHTVKERAESFEENPLDVGNHVYGMPGMKMIVSQNETGGLWFSTQIREAGAKRWKRRGGGRRGNRGGGPRHSWRLNKSTRFLMRYPYNRGIGKLSSFKLHWKAIQKQTRKQRGTWIDGLSNFGS